MTMKIYKLNDKNILKIKKIFNKKIRKKYCISKIIMI